MAKLLSTTAAVLLLAFATPTFAQTDAGAGADVDATGSIQSGDTGAEAGVDAMAGANLTIDDIDPNDAFGDLATDDLLDNPDADIAGFASSLDEQQRLELDNRCELISGNMDRFDPNVTGFCENYAQWSTENPMN